MASKKTVSTAQAPTTTTEESVAPASARVSRSDTLAGLMRAKGGATAADLAAAVGWQKHSVRGFISGTLKKRIGLTVEARRVDGATRYLIKDVAEAQA